MAEKKNQVTVLIEDCRHCPNVILKFDRAKKRRLHVLPQRQLFDSIA